MANRSRYWALAGMAAPLLFATLVTVGGFVQEGYSHATQAISELGGVEADTPIIQNLNFVVTGLLIVGLAVGLRQAPSLRGASIAGPLLVGYFGMIAFAHAFIPCDAGCEMETGVGIVHNMSGLSSFLAVSAGIFVLSRAFRRSNHWRPFATPSQWTAAAGLIALVAWIALAKAAGIDEVNGVLQRTFAGIVLAWIGVAGYWLWRAPEHESTTD